MAKNWLAFGAMAFGATLAAILFWPSSEPTYKGKPLRYRLRGYDSPRSGPTPTPSEAQAAVTAIGTNAIPTLLGMIQHRENPLETLMFRFPQMTQILRIRLDNENQEAVQAFTVLGTNGASATAQLIEIYKRQRDGTPVDWVVLALGAIGPPAKAATPILLNVVKRTNSVHRQNAMYAIGMIHSDAPLVVPVLISALQEHPSVGVAAISALEYYGPDAKAAVPALLNLTNDTNRSAAPSFTIKTLSGALIPVPSLRESAYDALLKIDPDVTMKDAAMKAAIHQRW